MTSEPRHAAPNVTSPVETLVQRPGPSTTNASQLDIVEETGFLRTQGKFIAEDSTDLHRRALFTSWQQRTNERGKLAPAALLEEIADLGFAWRDVARMIGVSVPAVQKWRRAGGVTGENRRRLASLLALCDEITERYGIQEIASWFEMPISSLAPVTPIDLYTESKSTLILEHAWNQGDSEDILNAYDPDWRERFRSDFEAYLDDDGQMSLRPKDA
ncbi:hypothetical protein ACH4N4_05230 [Streptomyces microflavus]|uniref:hypothetical protein n=1 Tax=Streptomyces microflavus TaxID=1919 RepID=UPI001F3DA2BC|nr:hypothetical protein [Streptomyces microflavus]